MSLEETVTYLSRCATWAETLQAVKYLAKALREFEKELRRRPLP